MQKVCCYIEIDGKKVVLKEKRLDECSKMIRTDRSSQYVVYILKAYFYWIGIKPVAFYRLTNRMRPKDCGMIW